MGVKEEEEELFFGFFAIDFFVEVVVLILCVTGMGMHECSVSSHSNFSWGLQTIFGGAL